MQPQDEQRLLTDHYDALIAENNDPVLDPPALAAYMERWDGAPFLELLALDGTQSVPELTAAVPAEAAYLLAADRPRGTETVNA